MKILVAVDIEGIAGVVSREQTRSGNAEYERARRQMTAEANAAIAGADLRVSIADGKFQGVMPAVTPTGSFVTRMRRSSR